MKVIFEIAPLDLTVDVIKDFYYQEEPTVHESKKYLYEYYHELYEVDKLNDKKEKDNMIYDIVKKEYDRLHKDIENKVAHFSKIWSSYNDNFISALSSYLNTSWHKNKDEIIGYVSAVPIFPRFVEDLSFMVHPNISDEKLIETTAHESTHFLWFKKISELNKKPYNEYTSEEWEFSEMVVDPILNSKELNAVLHLNEKAYPYFYEQEFNGEKIMEHLKNIFNEDISIEDKITKGFNYYLEYYKSRVE